MWDTIKEFFTAVPFFELLIIFVAKTVEVTLSTLRIILIGKGYRREGTILSFIEILLWVFVASTVINGLMEAPIRGLMYSIGFSAGVYIGSLVENYLAFGKILLQVIVRKEKTAEVESLVREAGFGITTIDAHGKDNLKSVLMIFANRKGKDALIKLIVETDETAMVVANEVSVLKGGYISNLRKIIK